MKSFALQINPSLINYNSAIRNKGDIITLLISIVRFLNFNKPEELENLIIQDSENQILLIIHIDKMSRVFIVEKNKIHTFQFPFMISISDDSFKIKYNNIEMASYVLTLLSNVFNDFDDHKSLEDMIELYWSAIYDLEVDETDAKTIEKLITFLLVFETGYLRFDYDDIQCSKTHPLNHLDFYYSSNNTFKIGINKHLDHKDLIGLLDISKKCANIKL